MRMVPKQQAVQLGIPGVGKDVPIETNESGGKQSKIDYRFDLLDVPSMFALAKVLDEGAKEYGENNWRKISVESNLNHAIMHILAYLNGDTQDDHLSHAFTRLMFALGVKIQGGVKCSENQNQSQSSI
jgi:hypothetical protein